MRRFAMVVIVGLLSACGDGGTTTPADRTSSSTGTRAAPSGNGALARAGLLRRTDLPDGWVESADPARSPLGAEARLRATPSCAPFLSLLDGVRVAERSPRFAGADGAGMTNSVAVLETPAEVRAHGALFTEGAMVTCIQDRVEAEIAANAEPGGPSVSVSVSPIAVEDYGDGAYGFRITAVESTTGGPVTTLTDLVGVAVGRVELSVEPTASSAGELAELEQRVIPKLVARLRAAGADPGAK